METILKRRRIKIKAGKKLVAQSNPELSYKQQAKINEMDMRIQARNLGIYY